MTFEQKCHVTDAGRQMTFYRCLDIRSYIISEWFVGVFEWKSTTVLMLLPALVLLVDTWNRPIAKLIEHKMTTGRQGNTRVILQWGWIWESEDILTTKKILIKLLISVWVAMRCARRRCCHWSKCRPIRMENRGVCSCLMKSSWHETVSQNVQNLWTVPHYPFSKFR